VRKAIHCSFQITGMVLAVLWLSQTPLWAAIYKWKDDQGKIHFTDNKSNIPLKYRNQLEKFKGVVEPQPEPVEEPVEPEKEKEAEAVEPVEEAKAEEEKKDEEAEKAKLVAILKETITYLENQNRRHQRLINFVKPDLKNGRYYIVPIRNGVTAKEQMVEKLAEFKLPSLIKAHQFLENSLAEDKMEKIGGDDYVERIVKLKARLESAIPTKERIIRKLNSDLKKLGK